MMAQNTVAAKEGCMGIMGTVAETKHPNYITVSSRASARLTRDPVF